MREAPLAAEACGIDASRRRIWLFLLSAAMGGTAGSLHPFTLGTVSPEAMEIGVMITALIVTVIGGSRRPAGAALAALLVVHLPEWLRGFEEAYLILFAAALLATIVFAPEGLVTLAERRLPFRWSVRPSPVSPGTSPMPTPRVAHGLGLVLAVEGIAMYAVFAYVEVYFTRWAFRSSMSAAA